MQRMSGMDASFLTTETASVHNHVVGTLIVDPSTAVDGFSIQKLKDALMARMHLLAPFRRRLVEVPFSLAPPLWIEDANFDIDQHIRRVAVPSPGSRHELAELVGDIAGRPLDRSRPLWEMWYVEGLAEGHVALGDEDAPLRHRRCVGRRPHGPPVRPHTGDHDASAAGHALGG